MLDIDFINDTDIEITEELEDRIVFALSAGLTSEGILNPVELTVSFVTPESIKALNAQYRDIDRETDVLSFPVYSSLEELQALDPAMPVLLGDIIINPDRAAEQAEEYGQSFEDEVEYLSVHSLMHLLGYDHMVPEDKKIMREREKKVLSTIRVELKLELQDA